ncbi:dihydrolipoamide dehydrogenase [Rhodoplanes roseus]|uniref:Dihydrolipoamide dehydrogenase n=2 Tax=Rhodoplanes roseus TaxID=29409 RepID=A0A327L165_9BRAD|nr:FAD-dependent oxidoreductase [Rhodoplanes roseus]RAI44820.1 dihydrolipoamide dehydrogenase [Rhodoplanes roseus]
MTERLSPDLCVVGGGAAGLSVAAAAAGFGVPVVLVERGRMGGECLNAGCVPSKALIAAARHARAVDEAHRFGVQAGPAMVDMAALRAHVRATIAGIAPTDSAARFTALGVRVIAGTARFTGPDSLAVDDATEITARRVVIATGSSPRLPPVAGLADVPFLTTETVFDLDVLPRHLLVIGAGPVGLELGQAFRRLGSGVTLVEAGEPLAGEDPEAAASVLAALRREGVDIRPHAGIARAFRAGGAVALTLDTGETLTGSHLLVAAGRVPSLAGLDLDRAGIAHGPDGIRVDAALRTTNPRVYAIGDAIPGARSTHGASHQAALVIRNALFRLPVRFDPDAVPRVVFTDPELARIGPTEAALRARGESFRVLRWPLADNDRARAERDIPGHVKLVTTRRGRILGASIVGAHAGEMITTWGLAVRNRLSVRDLAEQVVAYPTRGEIGKRAAMTFYSRTLTNPMVRRMVGWLRRLG